MESSSFFVLSTFLWLYVCVYGQGPGSSLGHVSVSLSLSLFVYIYIYDIYNIFIPILYISVVKPLCRRKSSTTSFFLSIYLFFSLNFHLSLFPYYPLSLIKKKFLIYIICILRYAYCYLSLTRSFFLAF